MKGKTSSRGALALRSGGSGDGVTQVHNDSGNEKGGLMALSAAPRYGGATGPTHGRREAVKWSGDSVHQQNRGKPATTLIRADRREVTMQTTYIGGGGD
jgi:hypothetical protein